MKLYRWFHPPKSLRYLQCSALAVILAFFGLCTITPTLPNWCGFGLFESLRSRSVSQNPDAGFIIGFGEQQVEKNDDQTNRSHDHCSDADCYGNVEHQVIEPFHFSAPIMRLPGETNDGAHY